MLSNGHGNYTPLDPSILPPLQIIYARNPSDSGKVRCQKAFLMGRYFDFVPQSKESNLFFGVKKKRMQVQLIFVMQFIGLRQTYIDYLIPGC